MSIQPSPPLRASELVMSGPLLQMIVDHLRDARPWEGVGLLATSPPNGEAPLQAMQFFPGRNVAQSATRFQMDPRDVLHAIQMMRQEGWYLGCIVHSHLYGPATPSAIDLREAHYPESWMLIVSFATEPPEVRVWCVQGPDGERQPVEVPVRIEAEVARC